MSGFSEAPLWYVARSTGLVAFVVLTVTLALGVASTQRALASRAWPPFATTQVHRNLSVLALGLLGVHVVATVADGYVDIPLAAAVVPFASPYRRAGLTLGALALDALLVVAVTGFLRRRMSQRSWGVVHRTAYLAWPLAFLHFLNTGTDAAGWGRWLALLCLAVVGGALAVRLSTATPAAAPRAALTTKASP